MRVWEWSLSMCYPTILCLAALWAMVERTRSAIDNRATEPARLDREIASEDSMTARELEAESEAAPMPVALSD